MGYGKSAEYINSELKRITRQLQGSPSFIEDILNVMIELGRVAKFRCRQNKAYKSFLELCFKDIATIQFGLVHRHDGKDFQVIEARVK